MTKHELAVYRAAMRESEIENQMDDTSFDIDRTSEWQSLLRQFKVATKRRRFACAAAARAERKK